MKRLAAIALLALLAGAGVACTRVDEPTRFTPSSSPDARPDAGDRPGAAARTGPARNIPMH